MAEHWTLQDTSIITDATPKQSIVWNLVLYDEGANVIIKQVSHID